MSGCSWPEQEAVWAWMKRHGIELTFEQERDLKDSVSAHRIEVQRRAEHTATVEYDLSPAMTESAITQKLIELGWKPPATKLPFMRENDDGTITFSADREVFNTYRWGGYAWINTKIAIEALCIWFSMLHSSKRLGPHLPPIDDEVIADAALIDEGSMGQSIEWPELTDRERRLLVLALQRLIGAAYHKANEAGQDKSNTLYPPGADGRFVDDAKTAEGLVSRLRKGGFQ